MGVQGLWQVLDPVGKPVDINRLRGKVFAIDVSIWLHQAVKGYRDKDGNPLPNAHLLGVFFRVCKLLNYGIKPVFVFDGGVPVLKKQTMSLRKTRKIEAMDKSEISRKKLLTNYIQQELQRKTRQALPPTLRMESTLAKLSSPSKDKSRSPGKSSTYTQDEINEDLEIFREHWSGRTEDDGEKFNRTMSGESSDSDSSEEMQYSRDYSENFSSIMSENFDALPLETQHEILFEMQESKKNNSWGKIHQMPKDLQSFSSYQMDRLVKRRTLQKKIQKVQQEMGQRHIHVQNLDDLLKMEYDFDENKSEVIASQEGGFVLVKTKTETNGEQTPGGSQVKNEDTDCTIIPCNENKDTNNITVDSEKDSSKDEKEISESQRLLLAIDLLQQQDKMGNGSGAPPTFSYVEMQAILGRIQSRLKEKEEKSNRPAEVITIDSEDDNDVASNSNSNSENEKIKNLVSSLKLPFSQGSDSISNNFKISWENLGGIPKLSFEGSSNKKQKSVTKHELVLLDDSNDATEISIQNKLKNLKNIPVIDLDEDQQLDLAMKLSMGKTDDDESDCCKVVFDNTTPKKVATPEKVTEKLPSSSSVMEVLSQQSKASSICAKFLDTVRFDEKVSSSIKGSQEEDSASSASDFEEVEEISEPVTSKSLNTPNSQPTINAKETVNTPVLTINLSKESLTLPPEQDIFSDIFGSDSNKNTADLSNGTVISNEQINSTETSIAKDFQLDLSEQVADNQPETLMGEDDSEILKDQDESEILKDQDESEILKDQDESEIVKDQDESELLKDENEPEAFIDSDSDSSLMEINGNENEDADKSKEIVAETSKPSTSNQKITRTLGTLPNNPSVKMITADYMQAQQKLNTEQSKLQQAKGFQERIATSITDQMYIEAQELLALFGIPYVISPMEAESQCAFLDTACLTDGTLTDDSDVWLFGGRRVYKNFFSQGDKHVEFFQYADVVRTLSLDREKLVLIAMLTGSDYTEGIEGVGPVTALEIISEFPSDGETPLEPLIKFREWWDAIQDSKTTDVVGNKVREKFKKLKLRPGFPNKAVYDAYLDPTIDNSTESFKWGNPDLDSLRTFTKMKFGWDQNKCDSTLLPVIKNLRCQANEMDRQMTMDKFVIFGGRDGNTKRKLKSQRLARAVKKIKRAAPSGELNLSSESSEDDNATSSSSSPEKKKPTKSSVKKTKQSSSSAESALDQSNASSGNSNPSVSVVKKSTPILQKVQDETNKKMNKLKAIEIFKNKKLSDG